MVAQHYRWDFVGLSTDTKPTPATSEKVVDGSTFYCSDTSKLYVFCKDTWYERKALGGGGGGTTYTAGDGIDITNDTISVDTDTIQEKLTAGTGIDITDNTISATGGGGVSAVKILTTEDFNFPANAPELIALWLLPAGQYVIQPHTKYMESGSSATNNKSTEVGVLVLTQSNNSNFTYSNFIVSDNLKNEYYKVEYDGTLRTGFPHDI